MIQSFLSGLAGSMAIPAIDFITKNAVLSDRGIINTPKRNLKDRPVVNPSFNRPDYSGAGERARRFQEYRLGTEIPGSQAGYAQRLVQEPATLASVDTPIQRAEKQERSRVAQLTEQDPLFKKYRVGELTKAYNTAATPEEKERIGLEIWATTNPQLAQRLKPGQVGYSEATSAFMSQSPLGQFQAQTGDMQYANKMAGSMEGVAAVNPFGQQALQMPLTGIQVPPTNRIGTAESFASYSPIPGAMQAFTDPMKFVTPEDTSEVQKALIKQAFASRIK